MQRHPELMTMMELLMMKTMKKVRHLLYQQLSPVAKLKKKKRSWLGKVWKEPKLVVRLLKTVHQCQTLLMKAFQWSALILQMTREKNRREKKSKSRENVVNDSEMNNIHSTKISIIPKQ